jgi:hypothetical protein
VFIPIDEAKFNANVEGGIKSEPVMDYDPRDQSASDRQKMVGPEGAKVPAWVIHVAYTDSLDPYGAPTETIKVRINSPSDPQVVFGPIMFGGVKCQEWEMNGKRGVAWSCESFTQEPKPSTQRAAAPAAEAKTSAGKK